MIKRIFVACGTGICTSTIASDKIQRALKERKPDLTLQITQGKISEVGAADGNYDLIVCTTLTPDDLKTPTVHGLSFLTGVGMEQAIDEIISKLGL